MCGRFSLLDLDKVAEKYSIPSSQMNYLTTSYNIKPSVITPIITYNIESRQHNITGMQWGFLPEWALSNRVSVKPINAKAENLPATAQSKFFQTAFYKGRCVVPADAFYEWRQEEGRKVPYRFAMKDASLFSFAGLYSKWRPKGGGASITTFTIITTRPNELVSQVHERMPVVLAPEDEAVWLNPEERDTPLLLSCLKPYDASQMAMEQEMRKL